MDILLKVVSIIMIALGLVLFFCNRKFFYKYVFVSLLFFPKVNLITVSNSATGIRYDDFIILLFFIFSFGDILRALSKSRQLRTVNWLMILWVIAGIVSTLYGTMNGTVSSPLLGLLTSVRKYEYFVAVFIGYYFFKKYNVNSFMRVLKISSVVLLFICLLQYMDILGGFVQGEYRETVGFPIAVFNGAYEYACFMCVVLAIFFYHAIKADKSSYLFCLIALIQILLTQSRSGFLLSLFIILAMSFVHKKVAFFAFLIAGSLGVVILINTTSILQRFASIDIGQMYNIMLERFANGDYLAALKELPSEPMFPNVKSDLSFYVRTTKWGAALNGFTMSPILGYGPGQLSVLDGSYVKILCEGGLVSAAIFIILLAMLFRNFKRVESNTSIWILISIMLFGLFIDIFDSSKIMEMFWMLAGSSFAFSKVKIMVEEKVVTLKLRETI